MDSVHLHHLATLYAERHGLSLATVSNHSVGHARLYSRIAKKKGCTVRTYSRVLQWFSDRWPSDLEWPDHIPRPTPSKRTNSSSPPAADSREATSLAMERYRAAIESGDGTAMDVAREEAVRAASALNENGQVALPNALCEALGVSRGVYDDVIRFYADGSGNEGKVPSRRKNGPSGTEQIFFALVAAKDIRFRTHWEESASAAQAS